jgi:CubicO group peptidase (beta-lactamase class C family)
MTVTARFIALIAAFLTFVAAPAATAPQDSDAAFMKGASEAVDRVAREDGFSGVILIARGDQVLLRKAAGFADRERNIPNTPESKFPLASLGKQFTATAIMLLVEDGKLSLDDPISKHYAVSPPAWKDVTIRHLLTHGSGIRDYWVTHPELRQQFEDRFHSYQDLFQSVINDPLGFQPGTDFSYSNAGYALLTAVIERLSGQSYGEFVRTRLFAPLGRHNTGYGGVLPINAYSRSVTPGTQQVEWRNIGPDNLSVYGGAGGIYSTLDDMLIWSRAFFGGRVLSPASMNAMLTDYGFNYGLGWRFAPKFGRNMIWHTGNGGGFASIFERFPEDDVTLVLMTNNTSPTDSTATLLIEGKVTTFPANAARKVVEEVERLYFGRAP